MKNKQTLEYIQKVNNFGSKPGLERITKLLNVLGNPQNKCKVIHLAGTNGKGSTTTMIANILEKSGFRVGKYISPYVYEFNERIAINNQNISDSELSIYVEKLRNITDSIEFSNDHPTEFEVITALAFLYFADQKCDFVCLETGLGGRFDATNVVDNPLVCGITKVSYDHTNILGNTLFEIATEKCGIIKNCPVVSYINQEKDVLDVIKSHTNELVLPDESKLLIEEIGISQNKFIYKGEKYTLSLLGEHQIYNSLTALEIINILVEKGIKIPKKSIKQGLLEAKISARMEIICKEPLIIIDGSHNLDGVLALESSIKSLFDGKRISIIMGMLCDKDYENSVEILSKYAENIIFVPVSNERTANPQELIKYSKCKNSYVANSFEDGVKILKNVERDVILACGSLYLAQDAKKFLNSTFFGKIRL